MNDPNNFSDQSNFEAAIAALTILINSAERKELKFPTA